MVFSKVDFEEFLRDSLEVWLSEGKLEKNSDVSVDLSFNLNRPALKIPESMFTQSFYDILDNAFEVSLESGENIKIHVYETEGFVVLDIVDNGQGFDSEVLKRLGEPFNTTKIQGSGLGLYQAKIMCQFLGGELKIFSEKNGSKVQFLLAKEVVYE